MANVVFAAGLIAKKLHKGQTDKGGNNYFESHLLTVATKGANWQQKVIGFLHDATEDCDISVEELLQNLDAEIKTLNNNSIESWWEEWMADMNENAGDTNAALTADERTELMTALNLLNHHTSPTREEYISKISTNPLALRVKLNDLENNMDMSRIPQPTEKDFARLERYKKEYEILSSAL